MNTGPVAERIEQIRVHMLREQRGEIACDHSRTHREELLGYLDMLARDLEDKTDEYDTLRAEFEQQRELCADHGAELVRLEVRAEAADVDLPLILHGSHGGSVRSVNGDTVYAAPCGYYSPLMSMTGLFGAITCPGCLTALGSDGEPEAAPAAGAAR